MAHFNQSRSPLDHFSQQESPPDGLFLSTPSEYGSPHHDGQAGSPIGRHHSVGLDPFLARPANDDGARYVPAGLASLMGLLSGPPQVQQAAPAGDDTTPPGQALDGHEVGNYSAVRVVPPEEMVTPPEPMKNMWYVVTVGWRTGIFGDWSAAQNAAQVSRGCVKSCSSWAAALAYYRASYEDDLIEIVPRREVGRRQRRRNAGAMSGPASPTPFRPMSTMSGSDPVASSSPTAQHTPATPGSVSHTNHNASPSISAARTPVTPGRQANPIFVHSASSTPQNRSTVVTQATPMASSRTGGSLLANRQGHAHQTRSLAPVAPQHSTPPQSSRSPSVPIIKRPVTPPGQRRVRNVTKLASTPSSSATRLVKKTLEPITPEATTSVVPATNATLSIAPFPNELLAHINNPFAGNSRASTSALRTPDRNNSNVGRRSSSVTAEHGSDGEDSVMQDGADADIQDGADADIKDGYPCYEFDDVELAELAELDEVLKQSIIDHQRG